MNKWLEGFAHRIDMAWWIFVLAALLAMMLALLTVGFQAVKAALANHLQNLRTE